MKVLYKEDVRKKRKAGFMMDNNKLKALGWFLGTDLRTGVKMTIDSYLSKE
jgi:nucleoside-diphosphate-sugar epimerase